MAVNSVNPLADMTVAEPTDVQRTLQVLALRVSHLGSQVETLLKNFDSKIQYLSGRLRNVEKRQAVIHLEDEFTMPDTKRIKVDNLKIPIPDTEICFMQSRLTGPVKEAIHELGRLALFDQDIALQFLRIGSDKSVATAALHSKELQPVRDSINWSFLPVEVVELLEQRFVKTVAKKVEHTKRKIRQHSSQELLASTKHGKTETPFLEQLLKRLMKGRDAGKCETTCSSMNTSNMSPNTAASTADDMIFEAKTVFPEIPKRGGSFEHALEIQIVPDDCRAHSAVDNDVEGLSKLASFT